MPFSRISRLQCKPPDVAIVRRGVAAREQSMTAQSGELKNRGTVATEHNARRWFALPVLLTGTLLPISIATR
jgi:hypothetical protein